MSRSLATLLVSAAVLLGSYTTAWASPNGGLQGTYRSTPSFKSGQTSLGSGPGRAWKPFGGRDLGTLGPSASRVRPGASASTPSAKPAAQPRASATPAPAKAPHAAAPRSHDRGSLEPTRRARGSFGGRKFPTL